MNHQDLLAWQYTARYRTVLNSSSWTVIVPQDPRRVVLTIGVGSRNNTYFIIRTDTLDDPPSGLYWIGDANFAVPFVTFNNNDHGILTQCNWYAYAPSPMEAFCIGVIMERSPCDAPQRRPDSVRQLPSGLFVPQQYESVGDDSDLLNPPLGTKPQEAWVNVLPNLSQ